MEAIFEFVQQHVYYAPFVIFFLLCLAGLNLPISEDAMLFISGVLAAQNPHYAIPLFLGVFLGAFVSDMIVFWLGYRFGDHLYDIKFFNRFINPEKVEKVKLFYAKYGVITLIIGRFIPFGVRNVLFLTAGMGKMKRSVFLICDFFTCLVSCSIYFTLYYIYGEDVIHMTKRFGFAAFVIFLLVILVLLFKKQQQKVS